MDDSCYYCFFYELNDYIKLKMNFLYSTDAVTGFERISSSADEAKYVITLEPFPAQLDNQFRTHRFFVNQSVPDVVAQILIRPGSRKPTACHWAGMRKTGLCWNLVSTFK